MIENISKEFQKQRISELSRDNVLSRLETLCSTLDGNDTHRFEQKLVREELEQLIKSEQRQLNRRKKFLSKITKKYLLQTSTATIR